MAPVVAVHGNMDTGVIKGKLPMATSVDIFDWKIGLTHSLHFYIGSNLMKEVMEKHGFNIFVSGHTHRPSLKYKKNLLLINPGSPTNPIPPFLTKPTVAQLKISKKEIEPKIINL